MSTFPEPRRSRLWIAWVILGVTVFGIVLALSFLVPQLVSALAAAPAAAEPTIVVDEEPAPTPSAAAVDPAVAASALEAYASAWSGLDCDKFMHTTTPQWRDELEVTDCTVFEKVAQARAQAMSPYTLTLESLETESAKSIIATAADPSLILSDDPDSQVVVIRVAKVHLRLTEDGWMVDDLHDLTDGRAEWETRPEEEQAATAAAQSWVRALTASDCEALFASTTPDFRARSGWSDCAGLQQFVQQREATNDLTITLSKIEYHTRLDGHFGEIIVTTRESAAHHHDEDGNLLDPPVSDSRVVELHLVAADGGWLIDNVVL